MPGFYSVLGNAVDVFGLRYILFCSVLSQSLYIRVFYIQTRALLGRASERSSASIGSWTIVSHYPHFEDGKGLEQE
jgi:hypothetical protein